MDQVMENFDDGGIPPDMKLLETSRKFLSTGRCCICNKIEHLIYHEACMHVVCRGCVHIVSEDISGKCMHPGEKTAVLPQSINEIAKMISTKIQEKLKCVPSNVALYAPYIFSMKKLPNGETALHKHCRNGNLEGVRSCLLNGADPNSQDFAGWTPLHATVLKENIKVAELLITYGALVNVPAYDRNYETPLFSALLRRKINMIKFFVENGADLNGTSDTGYNVFDYCLNDQEMMRALCLTPTKTDKYHIYTIPQPKVAFLKVDDAIINIVKTDKKMSICQLSDIFKMDEIKYLITEDLEGCTKHAQFASLQGILVLNPHWCVDFVKSNGVINPMEYIVKAPGFDLERAAMNMFNRCPKLFTGLYFHFMLTTKKVTVNQVKYTLGDFTSLVEAGSGHVLKRRVLEREGDIITYPYHTDKKSNTANINTYVISNSEVNTLREHFLTGVRVRSTKWFISCINNFKIIPDQM